jgi:hypothetical protein
MYQPICAIRETFELFVDKTLKPFKHSLLFRIFEESDSFENIPL